MRYGARGRITVGGESQRLVARDGVDALQCTDRAIGNMPMKKFMIIANLKQNGSMTSVTELVDALQSPECQQAMQSCGVVILPPVPLLHATAQLIKSPGLHAGVQMVSGQEGGAWTGCYDAQMVAELGARYVCVGHSERRSKCHEGFSMVTQQYVQAVKQGLVPILCVGETAEQRKSEQTLAVLSAQLEAVFSADSFKKLPVHDMILAYEPVWAIGAKQAASIEAIENVFQFLRAQLQQERLLATISLCYGGSVDEANCDQFMQSAEISGLLVGRTCLDADKFVKLVTKHTALCC